MVEANENSTNVAEKTDISMLYVTCGSINEAREIARSLVRSRAVACANILDGMQSIYWWQGEIEEEDEVVLILKTRKDSVTAVIGKVRELHTYAVPCVVELPLVRGNPAYLDWIATETRGRVC